MNGIDRISERILNDARAEAARIIEEAQERARSLKDDRTGQVEKENERYYQETIERARERKRRMLAMAGLEMRKEFGRQTGAHRPCHGKGPGSHYENAPGGIPANSNPNAAGSRPGP